MLDINVNGADVATLLKAIAQEAKLQVIMADDVHGKAVGRMKRASPQYAIEQIASGFHLAWCKVGQDTYLLVRRPVDTPRVLVFPPTEPPKEEPQKAPGLKPDLKPGPDWKPFEFNGKSFYFVPVDRVE